MDREKIPPRYTLVNIGAVFLSGLEVCASCLVSNILHMAARQRAFNLNAIVLLMRPVKLEKSLHCVLKLLR